VPHNLTEQLSGIVINQNQAKTFSAQANFGYIYTQEFFFPADYRRGTEIGELRYPDFTGFQLFVHVLDGYAEQASVEYTVEYQVFGLGWIQVASGVAIGAPADGDVWITASLDEPVEIDSTKVAARWRITFQGRTTLSGGAQNVLVPYANGEVNVLGTRVVADLVQDHPYPFTFNGTPAFLLYNGSETYYSIQQGIDFFHGTTPNPLALPNNARAYTGASLMSDSCFNFRVLGLVGDDGVDFLGNEYRSVVTRNKGDAISTAEGSDPDSFWLSKPNPSKFAVESLYFDVRKPGSTTYGAVNLALGGSFETATNYWVVDDDGTAPTPANGTVIAPTIDTTATHGSKIAKVRHGTVGSYAGIQINPSNRLAALPGKTYAFSIDIKPPNYGLSMAVYIQFWDNFVGGNMLLERSAIVVSSVADFWHRVSVENATAPSGTVCIRLYARVYAPGNNAYVSFDGAMLNQGAKTSYFDGDMDGYVWAGTPHESASYELVLPTADDISSVIDRVLVDPITPGAYFNVYYTEEGDPGSNDDQWENKLWTRIPQTYRMERKETHVFPEPIKAKYLKLEFSHLQAQYYAPGNFQQSIRYKKHPKWVLDYFLARMQTDASFLAERVAVVYDALDLAYSYYLDDLGQEPQTTIDVSDSVATQVASFLSNRTDVSDRIDSVTLDKINLALEPYRTHPALRGTAQTLLGDYARQTVQTTDDYPVEAARTRAITTADVSSLNRDRVVIEQNYPVMFFYLTARHKYREIEAKFTHDRAYFVGVRQIAFLRDNYMTAFDTNTYIEPAADTQNIERNEFI
jgi:hypothetical protein